MGLIALGQARWRRYWCFSPATAAPTAAAAAAIMLLIYGYKTALFSEKSVIKLRTIFFLAL